jgi:hypothetical protein
MSAMNAVMGLLLRKLSKLFKNRPNKAKAPSKKENDAPNMYPFF